MYHRNKSTSDPLKRRQYFLLEEIRGKWVSCGGDRSRMPQVHIYRTGVYHHRIKFSYDLHTVFNCHLWHRWSVTYFYLYGRIRLSYDAERDVLTLSDYGDYRRAED